jgi:hypothetical protein
LNPHAGRRAGAIAPHAPRSNHRRNDNGGHAEHIPSPRHVGTVAAFPVEHRARERDSLRSLHKIEKETSTRSSAPSTLVSGTVVASLASLPSTVDESGSPTPSGAAPQWMSPMPTANARRTVTSAAHRRASTFERERRPCLQLDAQSGPRVKSGWSLQAPWVAW